MTDTNDRLRDLGLPTIEDVRAALEAEQAARAEDQNVEETVVTQRTTAVVAPEESTVTEAVNVVPKSEGTPVAQGFEQSPLSATIPASSGPIELTAKGVTVHTEPPVEGPQIERTVDGEVIEGSDPSIDVSAGELDAGISGEVIPAVVVSADEIVIEESDSTWVPLEDLTFTEFVDDDSREPVIHETEDAVKPCAETTSRDVLDEENAAVEAPIAEEESPLEIPSIEVPSVEDIAHAAELALVDEVATEGIDDQVAQIAQREATISQHLTQLGNEVIGDLSIDEVEVKSDWLDTKGKEKEELKEEALAQFDTLEEDGTHIDTSRYRRYLRPALLALAGLLLISGLVVYFGFLQGGMTRVPDLIGLTTVQATDLLRENGLSIGDIVEEESPTIAVGIILNQEPMVDTLVRRGSTVKLIISGDAGIVTVPKVTEMTVEQARSTLNQERLTMEEIPTYDSLTEEGGIVGQLPVNETQVSAGSTVAVLVSQGPAGTMIPTPRVMGLSEEDARILLERAGFVPLPYHAQTTFGVTGEVVAQTPATGSLTYPGSPVQYLVSKNITGADTAVPDAVGMREENARLIISEAGFDVEVFGYIDSEIATGTVVAQMPLAQDMLIPAGSTVELLVIEGNSVRETVPDVLGTNVSTARETLRSLGFRPITVSLPVGAAEGNVYQQFPAKDSDYYRGLPVLLYAGQPIQ